MSSKFCKQEEISEISEKLRLEDKTIVTTNGAFDILHPAHVNLLERAKSEGDVLIVLLNSDESIKRFKGPQRPILNQQDRVKIISALESVDYVLIFNEDKPLEVLKLIKPNKHIKGGSFIPERIKEEKELLESWGGELKTFSLEEGYSTTNIIEKIKALKDQ